jgi:hypothetical protein
MQLRDESSPGNSTSFIATSDLLAWSWIRKERLLNQPVK